MSSLQGESEMKKLSALIIVIIVAIIGQLSPNVLEREATVHIVAEPEAGRVVETTKGLSMSLSTKQAVSKKIVVEQQELYQNLEQLFVDRLPTVVDPRQLRPQLLAINAQGSEAVQTMFAGLRSAETPVTTRLAIVDYLRYRLRWDDSLSDLVLEYVKQEIEPGDQQFQALSMADKAELLGAITKGDRLLARQVAETIDRPLFRNIISYEIYHALLESGEHPTIAQQFVRSFHRGFKL